MLSEIILFSHNVSVGISSSNVFTFSRMFSGLLSSVVEAFDACTHACTTFRFEIDFGFWRCEFFLFSYAGKITG